MTKENRIEQPGVIYEASAQNFEPIDIPRGADIFLLPEHIALRNEVKSFAEQMIAPRVAKMEVTEEVEIPLVQEICNRWLGVAIPTEYGGLGKGHIEKTVVIEELARVSGAMGAAFQSATIGVGPVLEFGTEKQKRDWLPRFASGECIPSIAMTEIDSGGHILGMQTTAVKQNNEYIFNGGKWLVGNSHIADAHVTVVRTGEGKNGLSAFIIEADRDGVLLGDQGDSFGFHGFSYGEIIFRDAHIPEENLLGEIGEGMVIAQFASTVYGRSSLSAVALGIQESVFQATVAFCNERSLYGKRLSDLPTIKTRLGKMHADLTATQLMAYNAVSLLDLGVPCDSELIAAKLHASRSACSAAMEAIEIFGGRSGLRRYPIERYLRDATLTLAPAGTPAIQELRLGDEALGFGKESLSGRLKEKDINEE